MIGLLVVAAVAQEPIPTVGDTLWLETRVPLAPRQILRPQAWDLGEIGQVLGPPVVELTADSAVVRYPVAFWFPGRHPVTIPGPIVVNPEGRSDTLSGRRLAVEVASVLLLVAIVGAVGITRRHGRGLEGHVAEGEGP